VSSVSGIRTAVRRHDVTAHDVANVNTPGFEERRPHQADMLPEGVRIAHISRTPNSDPRLSNTDLATEAGEQIRNKHTTAANARAVRVKDRMVGEIIDLLA
jgi:flagellar basal-body rod protein FlgC